MLIVFEGTRITERSRLTLKAKVKILYFSRTYAFLYAI
jgi:hypothetical protein